jgi:LysM repeat protein
MRWRGLALISVGANLVLAALWLVWPRSPGKAPHPSGGEQVSASMGRTNIVFRKQFFSWEEVESPDYPTYIANLRAIACPEQTIRDIIIADVNALYARRRATDKDLVTASQQWWRAEPDTNVVAVALEKIRQLDDERRGLLSRLLGSSWEAGDLLNLPRPSRPGVMLDGPVLGNLPTDIKQSLEDINSRSEARMQAYVDAQRALGKAPDPAELARLRQQTRDELAGVLSPAQLEEFLLRYSQYSNNLRTEFGQLRFFNPTPDEFRAIFRDTDALDQRIQLLADSTDPNSVQARQALEAQREAIIKRNLGPARYEAYRNLHDPLYRDAMAIAIDAGNPDAAQTIYQVNLAALSSQSAIQGNTNLTAAQKAIEMKNLELQQLQANTLATGQDLPPEPAAPLPPTRVYTIRPGDTIGVLAIRFGISAGALRDANPGVDLTKLGVGDSLIVPRTMLQPTAP